MRPNENIVRNIIFHLCLHPPRDKTITVLLWPVDTAELVRLKVPFALDGENLNAPDSYEVQLLGVGPVER